jgi:hypothetical protein
MSVRMRLISIVGLSYIAWPFLLHAQSGSVGDIKLSQVVCYIVIQPGSSDDANSIFLRKMALDAELLKRCSPTRFSYATGSFKASASAELSYSAGEPTLIRHSSGLSLYSVPVRFPAQVYPKALRVVQVAFTMADLAASKDLVQPSLKAIRLAAVKAGFKAGTAWILDMAMPAPGTFRVQVALAK